MNADEEHRYGLDFLSVHLRSSCSFDEEFLISQFVHVRCASIAVEFFLLLMAKMIVLGETLRIFFQTAGIS